MQLYVFNLSSVLNTEASVFHCVCVCVCVCACVRVSVSVSVSVCVCVYM